MLWLYDPIPHTDPMYSEVTSKMSKKEKKIADMQYEFA